MCLVLSIALAGILDKGHPLPPWFEQEVSLPKKALLERGTFIIDSAKNPLSFLSEGLDCKEWLSPCLVFMLHDNTDEGDTYGEGACGGDQVNFEDLINQFGGGSLLCDIKRAIDRYFTFDDEEGFISAIVGGIGTDCNYLFEDAGFQASFRSYVLKKKIEKCDEVKQQIDKFKRSNDQERNELIENSDFIRSFPEKLRGSIISGMDYILNKSLNEPSFDPRNLTFQCINPMYGTKTSITS